MTTIASEKRQPILFEEFFEMGKEEVVSPFITRESRPWAANLPLKTSLFAAFLLTASFVLSFSTHYSPFASILLIGVYFFVGIPSLIQSVEDLLCFEVNIDILMTVAAFSSVFIGSGMEGGLLLVLFALSGSMENAVTSKAKDAVRSLHKLSPTCAVVIQSDGSPIERSVKEITVGTHILVRSGEVVPLDGIVTEGTSSVNLVHLTGENFPVTKKVSDEVAAGAQNLEGALTLRVTQTSANSTLARIIELVTNAQEAKPRLQRWFDKVSQTYATTIILLSILFACTLPLILPIPFLGVEGSVYRALAFLIAASPCALIIAIPIAYLSAVSICAKQGILLKGGITLDALASCKAIAFDKTGTLTTGDLTCLSLNALGTNPKYSLDRALSIAYSLEKNAVHPIAQAILNFAAIKKIPPTPIQAFKTIPGYGLEAKLTTDNANVFIGLPEYILEKLPPKTQKTLTTRTSQIQDKGELVSVMLLDDDIFIFRFSDTLRPKMKETTTALRKYSHLRLQMLTGDHKQSAKRIAEELGIKEYFYNLRPEDKLAHVSKMSNTYGLAMVGDGINDAPALARATVGICMGKVGSMTAIEAADVVLLHDNIERLGWLLNKSYQTQTIVKQNLVVASFAILFASTPALAGIVPLWLAVLLHEGGTVLVGLNALRLLRGSAP